jgi:hypothetical protein
MGIEDAVTMDDDGAMMGPSGLDGPVPYSLRLASSARKRPRTSDERFGLSFSCDVVAMPETPLRPEDLPECFVMINVPQEVPGMSITGLSVELISDEEMQGNDGQAIQQQLFAEESKAGVVVEVALQTLDSVGRAVPNEKPVTVATFGDRGAGGAKPHTTNASYDGSQCDIPISGGQHVMMYAFVRTPASASSDAGVVDPALAKVVGSAKIVLHIVGHVILPPAEEGDEVAISVRNTPTTTCPRREARKFINKVHQRSSTQASDAALKSVRSILLRGLQGGTSAAPVKIAAAAEVVTTTAPSEAGTTTTAAAPASPKTTAPKQQQASPATPKVVAAGGSPSAEKARQILLKRREANADGTPSKTARKGLVPPSGKKRQ